MTLERSWQAIVDAVETVGNWRPLRHVQVAAYVVAVGALSGPYAEPDIAFGLICATYAGGVGAHLAADRRRAARTPQARAARAARAAAARLQAIEQQYRAENAQRAERAAAARRTQAALRWEWEGDWLAADGGVFDRPHARTTSPAPRPRPGRPVCYCARQDYPHGWESHARQA